TDTTDTTDTGDASDPVHPGAVALVRQQLEVLEMRHFVWQGEAWPGQTVAWDAAEEAQGRGEPETEGSDPPPSAVWQTRLRLTLPNLGAVTVSLRLDARGLGEMSGVDVRLTAVEPVTAAVLRAGAAPLANGLDAAGIKLLGLGVDLDEAA
ncbi:MAG: flagellar hook-length control protein FliK, partial [Nitrosospira sp.]|nr:flagellar hook-length control protein FliK [Nitrosospira sp.]